MLNALNGLDDELFTPSDGVATVVPPSIQQRSQN